MSVEDSGYVPMGDPETGLASFYAFESAEGEVLAADLDGNVVGALAEDGETWLEVEDGFEVSDPEYPGYVEPEEDPYALDERLAELEARAAEPRQVEYVPTDDYDMTADLTLQVNAAETQLGRRLTLAEQRAVFREAQADLVAGEKPDIGDIAERLESMGEGLLDVDSGHRGRDHAARVELITSRLDDEARLADHDAGFDDVAEEQRPQSQAYYDDDSHAERVSYVMDRMRDSGADPQDLYSSSDITPEWEDDDA